MRYDVRGTRCGVSARQVGGLCCVRDQIDGELEDPGRHDEEQWGGRIRLHCYEHGQAKLRDGPERPER